jgi:hypothetical protein
VTAPITFVMAGGIGLSLFNVSVLFFRALEGKKWEKRDNPLSPLIAVSNIKINIYQLYYLNIALWLYVSHKNTKK